MIIVLFHVIYFLGKLVYRRYNCADRDRIVSGEVKLNISQDKDMRGKINLKRRFSNDNADEKSKNNIRFNPPAYIQRYQAVLNVLTHPRYGGNLKKIVDFGCSELQFCVYLKNMTGVEEVLFVDIDTDTINMYKDRARPLHVDYLHRRSSPLVMRVLEGSITQPDQLLEDTDAVICIELIEHLHSETLLEVPQNVFGFIRPKVAIFTTPNAEFNVLFDGMTGFRHPDHKFEWTRKEFQDWANNIIARFPEYEVSFQGICNGPEGTENLGACSQMAVFHRTCDLKVVKVPGIEGLYKSIEVYEYPFEIDNRSDEQKILDDAIYYINKFSINQEEFEEQIPLKKLLKTMSNFYITEDYLKEILENASYTVVDRDDGLVVLVPQLSSESEGPRSWNEDDFLDTVNDWDEEPGPPVGYYNRNQNLDIDLLDEQDWDNEPYITVSRQAANENSSTNIEEDWEVWDQQDNASSAQIGQHGVDDNNENTNADNAAANNSTASIQPDDMSLEDIVTESRSTELVNSTLDSSIEISSFTETKGSDTSDTATIPCQQTQESLICIDKKIIETNSSTSETIGNVTLKYSMDEPVNDSNNSSYKTTSICSMFLEPSRMSHLGSTEQFLDSPMPSPLMAKQCEKLKLDSSVLFNNINESNFEDPKYTSSPHIPSTVTFKKIKITDTHIGVSPSISDVDLLCFNKESQNIDKGEECLLESVADKSDDKYDAPSTGSNEPVIGENDRIECSPQRNETPEKLRNCTGTIPKNISYKLSNITDSAQKDLKLERISPDTPESLLNSWSPEIMDSGYPNSNSPPDLSPVDDLSSIAHDRTLDSESPSVADAPRIGYFDMAENRDLANNNLDDEGNNMEPEEENPHINDIRPFINVHENDLENENDIYVARNNDFPIWLLRLLQRFDADGVRINLPIPQPPNENFGD
ncbi:uncharacterized protein LOC131668783 [Phymastichus coffea]|uniref:uncharacterized protein LOC131668783 n=1 Tax=Phymastichus coffea TaxID=108790 RepID=UPI00273BA880|nr:uncharacterized protein LOC131668783 [Phymastichus coffea]